ncbi:MAG: FAD binding domain-containing protein [Bauldia sp.]|nr:FAD binding domain-containing protein [Bauldia sp.]
MKPAPFAYERPSDVAGVLALLGDGGPQKAILAGGQSLVLALARRARTPELVIDINRIAGLDAITVDGEGCLVIGATARLEEVRVHPAVRSGWPLIAEALGLLANPVVRRRGTLVGNLANNGPGCEMAAVALVLDAEFVVERLGSDPSRVPSAIFLELGGTVGFVTAVRFPPPSPGGFAFVELSRRPQHVCTLGAAVQLGPAGPVIALAGFARAIRCTAAEHASTPEALRAVLAADLAGAGSADTLDDYRRDVAAVLVGDALAVARSRAA